MVVKLENTNTFIDVFSACLCNVHMLYIQRFRAWVQLSSRSCVRRGECCLQRMRERWTLGEHARTRTHMLRQCWRAAWTDLQLRGFEESLKRVQSFDTDQTHTLTSTSSYCERAQSLRSWSHEEEIHLNCRFTLMGLTFSLFNLHFIFLDPIIHLEISKEAWL